MKITKISDLTGNTNTMDIDISPELLAIIEDPSRRALIQNLVPNLPADHREFLISGATPKEWDEIFGED